MGQTLYIWSCCDPAEYTVVLMMQGFCWVFFVEFLHELYFLGEGVWRVMGRAGRAGRAGSLF